MDNTSINAMMGNGTDNADANPLTFRKDFGVTIQFNTTILIPECAQSSSFFVQSAHACSCNIGSFFPQDSVTAIRVVADKDFDDTHMAGSNVADFFQIREWNGNTKFPYLTSFEDYFSRSAPIYIGTTPNYWIDCLLTATNLTAGTYNFTFTFVFSDGHEIEKSIQAILE
ncbi:MAG: DUF5034 domain-containing protein [Bacteroidales bacterium]|jgi:hypothetical protein|nr:DUF5034 domain-containing protein [Bacteroidales bacterium]